MVNFWNYPEVVHLIGIKSGSLMAFNDIHITISYHSTEFHCGVFFWHWLHFYSYNIWELVGVLFIFSVDTVIEGKEGIQREKRKSLYKTYFIFLKVIFYYLSSGYILLCSTKSLSVDESHSHVCVKDWLQYTSSKCTIALIPTLVRHFEYAMQFTYLLIYRLKDLYTSFVWIILQL